MAHAPVLRSLSRTGCHVHRQQDEASQRISAHWPQQGISPAVQELQGLLNLDYSSIASSDYETSRACLQQVRLCPLSAACWLHQPVAGMPDKRQVLQPHE